MKPDGGQTVQMMVEENSRLQEQLDKKNRVFYSDLLVYMRVKGGLLYEEKQVEEILLVILHDILDAQSDGISAEAYFGEKPRRVADAMLRELQPSSFREKFRYVLYLFGVYSLFCALPSLVNPEQGLDLGKLALGFVLACAAVKAVLAELGRSIYRETGRWRKLLLPAAAGLGVAGIMAANIMLPPLWMVYLRGWAGMLVVACLMAGAVWFAFRKGNASFRPMLIPVLVLGTLAVLNRLPVFAESVQESGHGWIIAGAAVLSLIASWILQFRQAGRAG